MRALVTFSFALLTASVHAQWTSIPTGVLGRIESVDFVGNIGLFCQGGSIGRTTDGGATWSIFTNGAAFRDVDMADGTVAYAAGSSGYAMWMSTNGGVTWQQLTPFNSNSLWGVSAPSADRAYFCGTANAIWRTDNYAANLTVVNPTLIPSVTITDIHFVSEDVGFAIGETGKIWKTTNSGGSWSLNYNGSGVLLTAIHFPSAQTGYAVGSGGRVVRTTDGGESWEEIQATGTGVYLRSVHFADDMHGMIVGFGGAASYTSDGGTIWTALEVPTTENLYSTYMQGQNTVLVAGENGVMFRNSDLATSMRELPADRQLAAWPVPATGEVNLDPGVDATEIMKITLIDESGRQLVHPFQHSQGQHVKLDLSDLPEGIYQVRIATRNGAHYHARVVMMQ